MSIHIILGKPGSGKSLYGTARVINELRESKRNIVTNLPLHPGRLNEYLQQKYPNEDLQMVQRLRILSDAELRFFWKFRGDLDQAIPEVNQLHEATDDRHKAALMKILDDWSRTPSQGDQGKGVAFYLDEAHIAFNAREWATIGKGALHYLSQHRKLGDIVWVITQSPGNLDKQFRSVAEDFTALRNEYTAKFGPFRGRGRFVRKTYLEEPSKNGEPFETAAFTLDKDGIASCYDTARGIGVHGNKADIGRRAKGIPIWTLVPAALVLGLCCVLVPYALAKGVGGFVASKGEAIKGSGARVAPVRQDGVPPVVAVVGHQRPESGRGAEHGAPSALPAERATPPRQQQVWVLGSIVRNGRYNVILSDGRTLSEDDGVLSTAGRNYVETKTGERYWWKNSVGALAASTAAAVPVLTTSRVN